MILGIVGSRNFSNYEYLRETILSLYNIKLIDTIVSGGASGADKLSERFSTEFGIPMKVYLPDWQKYGKSAGMIRNSDIISNSDEVIAFWDGNSKGAANSINKAIAANKIVRIIKIENIINKDEKKKTHLKKV
jgi:hypothetical protein